MTTPESGSGTVRSHLIDALEAELVGPFHKPPGLSVSDAPERLRISPSRWYLTGFLVPRDQGDMEEPDDKDDDLGAGDDADEEESSKPDPTVKKVRRLPASMGLSVFLPPGAKSITVHACWADYQRIEVGERKHWSRNFFQRSMQMPVEDAVLRAGLELPDSRGLRLEGRAEKTSDGGLGVAVLLRYTLRLLTLDQLGRAATLLCALETLRQKQPQRLGDVLLQQLARIGRHAAPG